MDKFLTKYNNNIIDSKLIIERKKKLNKLRNKEHSIIYPNNFCPTHKSSDLNVKYSKLTKEEIEKNIIKVSYAGRIMLKRIMGKTSFLTVQDGYGKIQFFITLANIGDILYKEFIKFDIGDIIGGQGLLFRTNKGELSIKCDNVLLLTKCIRPLPDKFHRIANKEILYRQRYLDLIINPDSKKTFIIRSKTISYIRKLMTDSNFIETETPMLHQIPGGAEAKPFITHYNALNKKMFLRIAPELYLKRLIVGGFDRVFEINRNFRNEGISKSHSPEFTMMEFYAAYTDYNWLMNFLENLIRKTLIHILNTNKIIYQNHSIDLEKPFDKLTIKDAIQKYNKNYKNDQLNNKEFLENELKKNNININKNITYNVNLLQFILFENIIERKLWNPTFIINHPIDVSPLSRALDGYPNIAERFELFIAGYEIANGFSELNDPEDQERRFKKQTQNKLNNNYEEIYYYDSDYIKALEYGMPHTSGCGIGIDRFIMLLTDKSNIRDVILFPHLRNKY